MKIQTMIVSNIANKSPDEAVKELKREIDQHHSLIRQLADETEGLKASIRALAANQSRPQKPPSE